MWIATTVDEMRTQRSKLTGRVAFVPTMGALHEGHLSLIHRAVELAEHVVVSVFVNPTQFGPNEDFSRYPRPIEKDLEHCRALNVAGVFNPDVDQMYPLEACDCDVLVPALAAVLEGEHRPGHFNGVCRVVAKLFNMVQPTDALFGEKDYQQLRIIEAMVADLAMPINIVPCETVREPDGLAMSSRNQYLNESERHRALGLAKALNEAKMMIDDGESDPEIVERAMTQTLEAHEVEPEYAAIRHPKSLAQLDIIVDGARALVAGRVGKVRLIDNMQCAAIPDDGDGGK